MYVITFSIFYGIMLSFTGGIRAFDTAGAFGGETKALGRFIVSLVFINLVPFLHFVIIFYYISDISTNFFSMLSILGVSLSVFGFYRIFYGVLVRWRPRLYSNKEFADINNGKVDLEFSRSSLAHIIPGILYVFIPSGIIALFSNFWLGIILIIPVIVISCVSKWVSCGDKR